jgi:hypothetical protein
MFGDGRIHERGIDIKLTEVEVMAAVMARNMRRLAMRMTGEKVSV